MPDRSKAERGYFGIGIVSGKTPENVGGLWRSAHAFGAALIYTVAFRPPRQPTDTSKAARHVPLLQWEDWDSFRVSQTGCPLVAIENTVKTVNLPKFKHPERAIYVLGPEDTGLSPAILADCDVVVEIPTSLCLNVATAGSIVMYDRIAKAAA